MSQPQSIAYRVRWLLLILGLLAWGGAIWFWIWFADASSPWEWVGVGLYWGVLLISQWLFLCPRGKLRLYLTKTGRPMMLSIITAALATAFLSTAIVCTGMQIYSAFEPAFESEFMNSYGLWVVIGSMLALWVGWGTIFFLHWRAADRYTQLSRMVRAILAGSIMEMLIAGPTEAIVIQRDSCYCGHGSFWGLILGGTVMLWAFGPGIILLFLREKYRKEKLAQIMDEPDRVI